MWTLKTKSVKRLTEAEVKAAKLPLGRVLQSELTLTFANGSEERTVSTFVSTKAEAIATIKQNLARLNEQEELEAEINNDTLDLSDPVEPTKTKAEQDQEEWVKNWSNLQKIQLLINAGVLKGDEDPVTNLRNKVKTGFKPAYLDLI